MKIKNDKIIVHVICIVVAIVFWALITVSKNPINSNYFYKIPVTVKDTDILKRGDVEYALMEDKNSFTVDVKVTGPNIDLSKLEAKDIRATATMLSNFTEGVNSLLVTVETVNGLDAEVISTKYIRCNIEEIVTVETGVSARYSGSLAEGYYISRGHSSPNSIFVRGPRSIVNSVSVAEAVVDIGNKTESINENKPVTLKDNTNKVIDTSLLTLSQSSVDVTYDIYPTKTVPINVVITGEPADEYKLTEISPAFTNIKIAAPKEILSKITEIDTETIDITDSETHITGERKLKLPNGVIVVENSDRLNVIVVIEKIEDKEFIFSYNDIEYINKSGDLTIVQPNNEGGESGEEKQIIVTIRAVESVLNAISKENIKLIVDLAEAVEGNNELALNVEVGLPDVIIENIVCDTESINVNLEKSIVEGVRGHE